MEDELKYVRDSSERELFLKRIRHGGLERRREERAPRVRGDVPAHRDQLGDPGADEEQQLEERRRRSRVGAYEAGDPHHGGQTRQELQQAGKAVILITYICPSISIKGLRSHMSRVTSFTDQRAVVQ